MQYQLYIIIIIIIIIYFSGSKVLSDVISCNAERGGSRKSNTSEKRYRIGGSFGCPEFILRRDGGRLT